MNLENRKTLKFLLRELMETEGKEDNIIFRTAKGLLLRLIGKK